MLGDDLSFQVESFLIIFLCYLIGSIPFGLVLTKIFRKSDPRSAGSKNIGATNVLRLHGKIFGVLTLILDILKAFLPLFLVSSYNYEIVTFCSLSIFVGHIYSFWLKFKGGKGIAVFIGILTQYSFFYCLIFIFSWLIIFLLFRYSSLAALIASIILLIVASLFSNNYELGSIIFINFMIFVKHWENILRLINGKEEKILF